MFKGFIFEDDHISGAAPPISITVSDSLSEGSVIWGDMLIKKTLNEKGTWFDRKKIIVEKLTRNFFWKR